MDGQAQGRKNRRVIWRVQMTVDQHTVSLKPLTVRCLMDKRGWNEDSDTPLYTPTSSFPLFMSLLSCILLCLLQISGWVHFSYFFLGHQLPFRAVEENTNHLCLLVFLELFSFALFVCYHIPHAEEVLATFITGLPTAKFLSFCCWSPSVFLSFSKQGISIS